MDESERDRERTRRIGLNEAVFRDVNERLETLAGGFRTPSDLLDLVCECGSIECTARIAVAHADYAAIRADPRLFAVVSGHDAPDVETVVAQRDGYDVVRKHEGLPAEIARRTEP